MVKRAQGQYTIEVKGTGDADATMRRLAESQNRVTAGAGEMVGKLNQADSKAKKLKSSFSDVALKVGAIGVALYGVQRAASFVIDTLEEGARANTMQRQIDALANGAEKVRAATEGLQGTLDLTAIQGFVLKLDRAGVSALQIKDAMGFALAYSQQTGQALESAITSVSQALVSGRATSFRTLGIQAKNAEEALAVMRREAEAFAVASAGDVGIALKQTAADLANIKSQAQQAAAGMIEAGEAAAALVREEKEREISFRRQAEYRAKQTGLAVEKALEMVKAEDALSKVEAELYARRQKEGRGWDAIIDTQRIHIHQLEVEAEKQRVLISNINLLIDKGPQLEQHFASLQKRVQEFSDDVLGATYRIFRMFGMQPGANPADASLLDTSGDRAVNWDLEPEFGGGRRGGRGGRGRGRAAGPGSRPFTGQAGVFGFEGAEASFVGGWSMGALSQAEQNAQQAMQGAAGTSPEALTENLAAKNLETISKFTSQAGASFDGLFDKMVQLSGASSSMWQAIGDASGSKKAIQIMRGFAAAEAAIMAVMAGIKGGMQMAEGFANLANPAMAWAAPMNFLSAANYFAVAGGKAAQAIVAGQGSGRGAGQGRAGSFVPQDLTRTSDEMRGGVTIIVGGDVVAGDSASGSWLASSLNKAAGRGAILDPRLFRARGIGR